MSLLLFTHQEEAIESAINTSPMLLIVTTPEAIRDRIYTIIEALTPVSMSADRFRRYRNEGGADFKKWALANPLGSRRRIQVRQVGGIPVPEVSNNDIDEEIATFRIRVAYPQTGRDGPEGAMDRDDSIDEDRRIIVFAVGMCGRANFTYPDYPDASWRPGQEVEIDTDGDGVDFLEITMIYAYQRLLT